MYIKKTIKFSLYIRYLCSICFLSTWVHCDALMKKKKKKKKKYWGCARKVRNVYVKVIIPAAPTILTFGFSPLFLFLCLGIYWRILPARQDFRAKPVHRNKFWRTFWVVEYYFHRNFLVKCKWFFSQGRCVNNYEVIRRKRFVSSGSEHSFPS